MVLRHWTASALAVLVTGCGSRSGLFDAPTPTRDAGSVDASMPAADTAPPVRDAEADAPLEAAPPPRDAGRSPFPAILFGGQASEHGPYLGDTWMWDGATWSELFVKGPQPRSGAAFAELNGRLVLFGGADGTQTFGDTWIFFEGSWAPLNVSGPPARSGASMTVSATGDRLLLTGGCCVAPDTWTFDGVQWAQLAVNSPPSRERAVMATLGPQVLLFGGGAPGGLRMEDTQAWDGASWTQLLVAGPSARNDAVMAPFGGGLVLFGGDTGSLLSDTWTWNGQAWGELGVTGPSLAGGALSAVGGKLVMFGGYDVTNTGVASTWLWDGAAWTAVAGPAPPPRYLASMATEGVPVLGGP